MTHGDGESPSQAALPALPALQLGGIHHVAIIVSDYARSRRFYTDVLGLQVVSEVFRAERQSHKLDLQLWVENLFDKAYYINLLGYTKSTGIIQGYPGNPRTFGVTARVKL